MHFSGTLDSRGLCYPWGGPEFVLNTEPNTQHWITAWYATGCQILDSLFLMKIPPVIPRISCCAKKKKKWAVCVFCCGLNFFPALHSSLHEQRGKGGGSSWLLFLLLFFCLTSVKYVAINRSQLTKCFCFSLQKHMGTARKAYGHF